DLLGLEQDDPRLRLQLPRIPGGPHPRVATADDEDVGLEVGRERRPRLDLARLLDPVAKARMTHPWILQHAAPRVRPKIRCKIVQARSGGPVDSAPSPVAVRP